MRSTRFRLAVLLSLGLGGTALVAQAPAGATAKCKDGTYSTAKTSSGRCSNHGGVAQLINTTSTSTSGAGASTQSQAPTSTAAGGVPANATFQCKDGTYSTAKTTSGACSRHGGVDHPVGGGAAAAPASAAGAAASTAPAGGAAPKGATFQCKDGTYSTAKTAQGACSRHGGVDHALTAAAPAAAAPAAPAAAAGAAAASSGKAPTVARPAGAPANATAKCKDGTYSESTTHSGTCSHHGGVVEWYQ